MTKRQVVTIDVTFDSDYSSLNANDIMELLIAKRSAVKNISIQIVNKKKDTK